MNKDQKSRHLTKSTRVRQSFYLSKEVIDQVDKVFKKMQHDLYPGEIDKAEFLDELLLLGIDYDDEILERIKEKKGEICNSCGEWTHKRCDRCGAALCDDCAINSGDPGLGQYLITGTRYCPGECAKKETGFDDL
jgi:hypothetical protein